MQRHLALRDLIRISTHTRAARGSLGAKTDFQIGEERSGFFVNVGAECNGCATLDRAAFREDGGQVNVVGVDLEGLLALTVIDTVHSHGDEAVAGHFETWVSLSIELLK